MINWFKPFNLIFCSLVVVGLVFFTRSITSFASTPTSYSTYYRTVYQQYNSSSVTYDKDRKYGTLVNIASSNSSYGISSSAISSHADLFLITTEGSFLIASGSSNGGSGVLRFVSTGNRYYAGYPCGTLMVISGSCPVGSSISSPTSSSTTLDLTIDDLTLTDPLQIDLSVIKSDTQTIISMLQDIDISTLESLLSSIYGKVNNIDTSVSSINLELIDIEGALGGTNSRLTDILFEIYKLKKSLCFDFADTIDGNYHLSHVFFDSSFTFNNNPLDLGFFAFDVTSYSGGKFIIRVPESHMLLYLYSINNNYDFLPSNWYDSLTSQSFSVTRQIWGYNNVSMATYITIPSNIRTGSYVSFDLSSSAGSYNGRFAMYEYVVGANDILNYMKDQWAQSSSAVSDLGGHSSNTGDLQVDVFETESSYFGDFESAVSGAGVTGFNWSVFNGMTIFSAIVGSFYNLLPSEFALYITAVLIVGCIAVFLSAIGRVIKKGGSDG